MWPAKRFEFIVAIGDNNLKENKKTTVNINSPLMRGGLSKPPQAAQKGRGGIF